MFVKILVRAGLAVALVCMGAAAADSTSPVEARDDTHFDVAVDTGSGLEILTLDSAELAHLAATDLRSIVAVDVDSEIFGSALTDDPLADQQWALDFLGLEAAWDWTAGEGVTIALLDSGVRTTHEDLSNVGDGIDIRDPEVPPTDGSSPGGQARHARRRHHDRLGRQRPRGLGVAPRARVVPVRILDDFASGRTGDLATALVWAPIRASTW
jgi:subtilisin family serine protease